MISSSPSKVWDAQDLHTRFSIDTGLEFLFGSSPDTLGYDSGDADEFNSALDKIQERVLKRNMMGSFWPFLEFLKDRSQPYAKTIDSWMEPLVNKALQYKRMAKNIVKEDKNADQATFLEYLADNTEGAFSSIQIQIFSVLNSCVDVAVIRDQLKNILFASRDSVGINQRGDHNNFNNLLCVNR